MSNKMGMGDIYIARPLSTFAKNQRVKMKDVRTGEFLSGFVVVEHGKAIADSITPGKCRFQDMPGATVVAFQGSHENEKGYHFYTMKSSALAILDE